MKRLSICFFAVLASLSIGLSAPRKAEARLQYYNGFKDAYGEKIEGVADAKCGICHGGNKGANKKKLSKYGQDLLEALRTATGEEEAKNVKDKEKIAEALKAVEAKEYESGKTYGDLLKEGKLPPAATE